MTILSAKNVVKLGKEKMKEHTAKNHADIHKGGWMWHIKLDRNTFSEVTYSGHRVKKLDHKLLWPLITLPNCIFSEKFSLVSSILEEIINYNVYIDSYVSIFFGSLNWYIVIL